MQEMRPVVNNIGCKLTDGLKLGPETRAASVRHRAVISTMIASYLPLPDSNKVGLDVIVISGKCL